MYNYIDLTWLMMASGTLWYCDSYERSIRINKIFEIDKQIKEKAKDVNKKKIICLTTNEIFFSVKEAREKYNCDSHISDCLKGRRKYCGKLKDGTKLQWMYYEDYINKESVIND